MKAAVRIRLSVCAECGGPLPAPQATGRPRSTCSPRCRNRQSRRRAALPWPPVAPPKFPRDPGTVRRRTAEAMVAVMEGHRPAPPIDQLAQALLELDWITYHLAALEASLPRRLAGLAGDLAKRIRMARVSIFPEGETG